jgi:hypothetical protein
VTSLQAADNAKVMGELQFRHVGVVLPDQTKTARSVYMACRCADVNVGSSLNELSGFAGLAWDHRLASRANE